VLVNSCNGISIDAPLLILKQERPFSSSHHPLLYQLKSFKIALMPLLDHSKRFSRDVEFVRPLASKSNVAESVITSKISLYIVSIYIVLLIPLHIIVNVLIPAGNIPTFHDKLASTPSF
jgi:hypothetical protein